MNMIRSDGFSQCKQTFPFLRPVAGLHKGGRYECRIITFILHLYYITLFDHISDSSSFQQVNKMEGHFVIRGRPITAITQSPEPRPFAPCPVSVQLHDFGLPNLLSIWVPLRALLQSFKHLTDHLLQTLGWNFEL